MEGDHDGEVLVDGQPYHPRSPPHAIRHGVMLVPEDRKGLGLILSLAVDRNIALPSLERLQRWGLVDPRGERQLADRVVSDLDIRVADVATPAQHLSGGNQQKVVVGKWLARDPKLLILDEPLRGIDVNAKSEIHRILSSARRRRAVDHPDLVGAARGARAQRPSHGHAQRADRGDLRGQAVRPRRHHGRRDDGEGMSAAASAIRRAAAQGQLVWFLVLAVAVQATVSSEFFLTSLNLSNATGQMVPLALRVDGSDGGDPGRCDRPVRRRDGSGGGTPHGGVHRRHPARIVPVILGVLVVGALIGSINGAMVVWLRFHPLIATLITFNLLSGAALAYTTGPIGGIPSGTVATMHERLLGLPYPVWIVIALPSRRARCSRGPGSAGTPTPWAGTPRWRVVPA